MKTRISILLLCAFVFSASAQQEAVSFYASGDVVGYALNGAGYAFSPNVPIAITALGFNSADLENSAYQVSLYNSNGVQLASAEITTNSTSSNQTYYQSISSITLTAGDLYYLGAGETNANNYNVWVGGAAGPSVGGSFAVNPDITYLDAEANFISGIPTNSEGSAYFLLDENFQFTPVPEPSGLYLGVVGLLGLARWRRFILKRTS